VGNRDVEAFAAGRAKTTDGNLKFVGSGIEELIRDVIARLRREELVNKWGTAVLDGVSNHRIPIGFGAIIRHENTAMRARAWIFLCLLYLSKLNKPVIISSQLRSPDMPNSGVGDARRLRFERLVAPWRDDLYRYAFWLSKDPDLAEDIVQEAMLRAFRSLESLQDEGSVKAWLLTIARREHARVYERKRLQTQDIDELSAAEAALIATGEDTDVDDMRQAILQLDDGYREPLLLQVMFGLSTEEIAAAMNLKQGAVLTRLHRARKRLIEQVRPGLSVVAEK